MVALSAIKLSIRPLKDVIMFVNKFVEVEFVIVELTAVKFDPVKFVFAMFVETKLVFVAFVKHNGSNTSDEVNEQTNDEAHHRGGRE